MFGPNEMNASKSENFDKSLPITTLVFGKITLYPLKYTPFYDYFINYENIHFTPFDYKNTLLRS